jgi:hypothetical protein
MSDNGVAGFVTALLIAPLVVVCCLGPAVLGSVLGALVGWLEAWILSRSSVGPWPPGLWSTAFFTGGARAAAKRGRGGAYVHCAGLMYAPHNRLQNRIARLARPNPLVPRAPPHGSVFLATNFRP